MATPWLLFVILRGSSLVPSRRFKITFCSRDSKSSIRLERNWSPIFSQAFLLTKLPTVFGVRNLILESIGCADLAELASFLEGDNAGGSFLDSFLKQRGFSFGF